MYAWPVLLPAQTNREDFVRTISLFDDDTGAAIDLSGRTLAAPGDFTGNVWTVTDGAIITNSVSQLTIKDYPIQAEMQAMALTVGLNLNILAGDLVKIADPTGLNTLNGYVTSYAPASGALVVQVGAAFNFEIRSYQDVRDLYDDSYGSASLIGFDDCQAPLIAAALGTGISVIDVGVVQVRIPATTIASLRYRTYQAAMAVYLGPDTRQLFVGKLPMLSGGLSMQPFATAPSSNRYGLP